MKNNEMKNENTVETEVKESKFKTAMTKVGAGVKKHGKKVAGLAALAVVGTLGYVLGSKKNGSDEGYEDVEVIDLDEESVEDESEE